MAKQTETIEEGNLRRQARRRLVGAVALVVFLVILLPAVFDGEPGADDNRDIALLIPDKNAAGDFQPKIDLPELDKMASEVAESAPLPLPVVAVPVVVAQPAAKVEPPSKIERQAKPDKKPKVESKPAVKATVTSPKSGWSIQVGAFAKHEAAKDLQSRLSKQGYPAYTEQAGANVRVRVGSYKTRESAEAVRHKLEGQGLDANLVNLD